MHSGARPRRSRSAIRNIADCVVLVFARAPIAGRVKTRVAQRLGAQGAAQLHKRLTRTAVRIARAAGCGAVEVHVTQPHAFFRTLKAGVRRQRGADLGERMHQALRRALRLRRRALLMGTDCPVLKPQALRRAARWLQGGADVVLAPAEDGGYTLIAARRISAQVFANVDWGTPEVMRQTQRNIARAGLRARLLPAVWDVDRPSDLDRLRALRFSSAWRRGARQ